jgi:DNA ligase-1
MNNFPKLYKKSKHGKISEWEISVSKNVIYIEHGFQDGKKQKEIRIVKEGKNLDRVNATDAQSQAVFEAESKWKQQVDKGYTESIDNIEDIVYLPMLAHKYQERGHLIKFPCYVSEKLDGLRMFATVKNGEVVLTTRKGKRFLHLEHLFSDIQSFPNIENMILDGECFSHEISFQRVTGISRSKTLKEKDLEDERKIKFFIFDCVLLDDLDAPFEKRYKIIEEAFDNQIFENLLKVPCIEVQNEKEAMVQHERFTGTMQAEGTIFRNKDGVYSLNQRSNDLQKYKDFMDEEFKVVGFTDGKGRMEDSMIFECITNDGKVFEAVPKGTSEQRKEWFRNGNKFIGKMLTVKFQNYTEDGKPRFPVAINIRDDI